MHSFISNRHDLYILSSPSELTSGASPPMACQLDDEVDKDGCKIKQHLLLLQLLLLLLDDDASTVDPPLDTDYSLCCGSEIVLYDKLERKYQSLDNHGVVRHHHRETLGNLIAAAAATSVEASGKNDHARHVQFCSFVRSVLLAEHKQMCISHGDLGAKSKFKVTNQPG
jgi:hypothetical protein